MRAGVGAEIGERWHAAKAIRDSGIVIGIVALVLLLPPLVYGFLVWRQFDFLDLSGYVPYDEARQSLAGGDLLGFLGTPLLSMKIGRLVVARNYGFSTWRQLEVYVDHPAGLSNFLQLVCLQERGAHVGLRCANPTYPGPEP